MKNNKFKSHTGRNFFALLAFVLFGLSACHVEPLPDDSSPPQIRWVVQNRDTRVIDNLIGDAEIKIMPGDRYSIFSVAEDDGGMQRLKLTGEKRWFCHENWEVERYVITLEPQEYEISLTEDGEVSGRMLLFSDPDLDFDCGQSPLLGGVTEFKVEAVNFAGLESRATLKLKLDL